MDVPLTEARFGISPGTDSNDKTVGDLLSGFFSYQTNDKAKNSLVVTAKPFKTADGKASWKCRVWISHVIDEEEVFYHQGVDFQMTAEDHKALRDSFHGTGSG